MTPMNDDDFLAIWEREVKTYNLPSETPSEDIWDAIQARRAERRAGHARRRWWIRGSVAAAAVLVIGIAVGRVTAPPGSDSASPRAMSEDPSTERTRARSEVVFRMVADEHLWQTESLLSLLDSDDAPEFDEETSTLARDLLTTTRLLMDSPASESPTLRDLFLDLELVLAQIVQVATDDGDENALEWIREGLNDRAVLTRLRTAIPTGSPRAGV